MEQYLLRRNKLRQRLKSEGLSALLITNFTNVSYLTGFTGDDSFLIVHTGGDVIISDTRYEIQIAEECPQLEANIRATSTTILSAIEKVLAEANAAVKKLGVEAGSMNLSFRDALADKLPQWSIFGTDGFVETLRMIKDKYEIESLRKSLKSAQRGFELIRFSLDPEQSEIEIRNELEYAMRKFGADDKGFNTIVAVGPRAALPHAVPTSKRVKESELLLIDWGAKREGYVSDLTRTLITKTKPSTKLRKVYQAVLTAQKKAIDAIQPGVAAGDIDRVARKSLEEAGFGKYFTHNLGHGLGLEVHESGRFSRGGDMILKPGMILTVEPGVYLPDWGGVRIEDNVLITKSGVEVLSSLPKEFEEMIVDL